MRTVIAATLQWTQRFPIGQGIGPPTPYSTFANLLRNLREKAQPRETVSVMTFNYDLGLDYAIHCANLSVDYCLGPAHPTVSGVPLLKLHGSLNWRECPKCHAVVPIPVDRSLTDHFHVTVDQSVRVLVRKAHVRHCDEDVKSAPVLVPPTWNKTEHHRQISPVWGRAARELSEAENIIVMGYSLPNSDAFFRYLYALGSVGDSRVRRFWVYDIDESGGVESRFRSLLGPGAEDRFLFTRMPFEQALPHLSGHFNYS
jgi:hypothetical protein